ncbi:MAG: J domain-containing protein [Planctomycetota bacterium]
MRTGLKGGCPGCFTPIGWERLSHEGIIRGRTAERGGPFFTIRCPACGLALRAVGGEGRVYCFFEERQPRGPSRWSSLCRALFGKPVPPGAARAASEQTGESEEPRGAGRRAPWGMRYEQRLALLGLPKDADMHQVKARYRSLVKECHPDLFHCATERERKEAELRFVCITTAYQELQAFGVSASGSSQ